MFGIIIVASGCTREGRFSRSLTLVRNSMRVKVVFISMFNNFISLPLVSNLDRIVVMCGTILGRLTLSPVFPTEKAIEAS